MKTILITGASGFFGGHLYLQAHNRRSVYGTFHSHKTVLPAATARELDLADTRTISDLLENTDPEAVILAAVMQADACERDPDAAERINVISTGIFAEWCGQNKRRLIYLSSDQVFDGAKGMYSEMDRPEPINAYGRTKLAAEGVTLGSCENSCVVRLPLMYGFPVTGGSNFFHRMLQQLRDRKAVTVFKDQYRTPGLADNIAAAVLELVDSDFTGIIHVAGLTRCSREEMARAACELWQLDTGLLRSASMYDAPALAPRAKDASLDCSLASDLLQTRLLGYQEGLRRLAAP